MIGDFLSNASSDRRNRRRLRPTTTTSSSSSVYPLHPPGSQWLARVSETEFSRMDQIIVGGSSLLIVGSFLWVPCLIVWAYRKWKQVQDKRRKTIYAGLFVTFLGVYLVVAPHKNGRVGKWLNVKKWKIWESWIRFLALEVILDRPPRNSNGITVTTNGERAATTSLASEDTILAFCPHGIFPFAFGVGALTDWAQRIFGSFRPIVASAVLQVPIFGDLVGMIAGLDASKTKVDRALARGERVGVIPGGISEMFTGYPRSGCHPDEEYAIVRKGFLRMALRHQKPVIPIYCFGSTKLFRRLELPSLEKLSNWLRMSFIVFYGVCGLPIPFRQRLTYIVGEPITPPFPSGSEEAHVNALHDAFCDELHRLFERHKNAYGWGHKTLTLLSK